MVTEKREHSLSGKSGPETKGFFKSVLQPKVEVVADDACRGEDLAIGGIFKWPGKDAQRDPVGCAVEMPVHRQLNGMVSYVEICPCQGGVRTVHIHVGLYSKAMDPCLLA